MLVKLIALLQVIAIKGSYFDILINSDVSTSALQYSFIAKEKIVSALFCLSACNLNKDCLTVVYHTTDLNCFLFQDHIGSSDVVSSTSTNLYFKTTSKSTL